MTVCFMRGQDARDTEGGEGVGVEEIEAYESEVEGGGRGGYNGGCWWVGERGGRRAICGGDGWTARV